MKKSNYTEEQIIGILKEVEARALVSETCRKHSIAEATYYKWNTKYAGLEVSQLRRMKELESENAKLKRMFAELSLEHHALKGVMSKKF